MTDERADTEAAELALGLLEGDERAAALRRVLAEPGFAAEVEAWRGHFATLFAAVPAVEPSDALLPRIEAEIAAPGVPVATPRRWLWPSAAAISSLAAALLLAILLSMPAPQVTPTPPVRVTQLAAALAPITGGEPVAAIYSPGAGELRLTAAAFARAGRSAELWVIGGDGVPHSLGLLRGGAVTALIVAPGDRARLTETAVLAVSIEPAGGSPTGRPTGPVVAKGALALT